MLVVAVGWCQLVAIGLSRHWLVLLLLMSVGVNMSLSQELRVSRREAAGSVLPGTMVPPMRGVTRQGIPTTIQPNSAMPTVFYYFSAACGWCERNWANIDALVNQTRGRYRVVGIAASDEVPAAITDRAIPLSILTSVDSETLAAYGFRGTPQTVVIAGDGRVLKSWTGAYQGAQADSVATFFGVRLPGLLPKHPQ